MATSKTIWKPRCNYDRPTRRVCRRYDQMVREMTAPPVFVDRSEIKALHTWDGYRVVKPDNKPDYDTQILKGLGLMRDENGKVVQIPE